MTHITIEIQGKMREYTRAGLIGPRVTKIIRYIHVEGRHGPTASTDLQMTAQLQLV